MPAMAPFSRAKGPRRSLPRLLTLLLSTMIFVWTVGGVALLPTMEAAALDASAEVGLQERAPFQEQVDYTLTDQSGGDFRGQDLNNASFAGATACAADFGGADLHGAILTQGSFPEASFQQADLSDALMDRADFRGADLTGALLRGVIASGSGFLGARVDDADFSEALLDLAAVRELCRDAEGRHPETGVETRVSLGC